MNNLTEPDIPVKLSCSFTFDKTIFHFFGEKRLHV